MQNPNPSQPPPLPQQHKISFYLHLNLIIELDSAECEILGELRSLLAEHPLLKIHPNFLFKAKGLLLKEHTPLSVQLGPIDNNLTVNIILSRFNYRSAEEHVRQLASFFQTPSRYLADARSDFALTLGRPDFLARAIDQQDLNQLSGGVGEFKGDDLVTLQKCRSSPRKKKNKGFFGSLVYSLYNPVASNDRCNGDLLYLDLLTKEGAFHCITINEKGVYRNSSTPEEFNSRQDSKGFFSLLELFAELSVDFSEEVSHFVKAKEGLGLVEPSFVDPDVEVDSKWLCSGKKSDARVRGLQRLSSVLSDSKHGQNLVVYRDWIEEFHNCRLLPGDGTLQQLHRLKVLRKTHADFVDAGAKLAKAVVEEQLIPLNPNERRAESCFVYNNLFATYAEDRIDWELPKAETAPTTYSAVNVDIKNLNRIFEGDLKGVNVINTSAVDYMGRRVIVQSVIQGILHFDQKTWNCYGSIDDGKTMNFDKEFHDIMEKLADYFYLTKDNLYKDEKGKEFVFHGSPEVKGIKAGDNRKYIMDLMRLSPRDVNFEDKKSHECCVLRPELITNYMFFASFEENMKKQKAEQERLQKEKDEEAAKKKIEEETKEEEKKEENREEAKEETKEDKKEETKEEVKEDKKEETKEEVKEEEVKEEVKEENKEEIKEEEKKEETKPKSSRISKFNPSISTFVESENTNSTEEKENLRKIADFLTKNMIPTFISNLTTNNSSIPLDITDFASSLHKFGINIRYIGKIYTLLNKKIHTHYRKLIERFVIIRSIRKLLREIALVETKQTFIDCVIQYLNMFLGNDLVRKMADDKIKSLNSPKVSKPSKKKKKKRKFSVIDKDNMEVSNYMKITSDELFNKILEIAEKRYGFPKETFKTFEDINCLKRASDKTAFLRDSCLSLGIILKLRNYSFSPDAKHVEYPIKARDIIDFKPKTKSAKFNMEGLQYNYKNAEHEFNNRNFDAAFSMFQACQQLILSAYGILNADFLYVTNKLATIAVMKGNLDLGIKTQLFVTKLCEKFYGVDSTHTALNLLSLSNFLHDQKKVSLSVSLHTKALRIFDLIGSDLNPNSLLCLQELLLMTEETKDYLTASIVARELLDRHTSLFGETDERLLFLLAKLAGLRAELNDFKEASLLQVRHMFILKRLLRVENGLDAKYRTVLSRKLDESEKLKNLYVKKSKENPEKKKIESN